MQTGIKFVCRGCSIEAIYFVTSLKQMGSLNITMNLNYLSKFLYGEFMILIRFFLFDKKSLSQINDQSCKFALSYILYLFILLNEMMKY